MTPDKQPMEEFRAVIAGSRDEDALLEAQHLIYEAWEQANPQSRIMLARKALTISPLCADAYNLLAEAAKTPEEAFDLYIRAVEAGAIELGPAGFEEAEGHFWGVLETRPYMRARHGLAMTLLRLGEEEAAIEHFRDMLRLNPNDNQGIRYLLLAALFRRDDIPGVKVVLAAYADEWSASWLYTRALIAFREGAGTKPANLKLLKEAWSSNEHVPALLTGAKPLVVNRTGYVTMGGADEATDYVIEFGKAWKTTPGAVAWLIDNMKPVASKRTRAKVPSQKS